MQTARRLRAVAERCLQMARLISTIPTKYSVSLVPRTETLLRCSEIVPS